MRWSATRFPPASPPRCCSRPNSSGRNRLFGEGQPALAPFRSHLFGQHARGRVVLHALADALRAQFGQEFIEALAAEVEGLGVGAVAQSEYPIAHSRQVGARRLKVFIEALGVVWYVALAV